MAINDIVQTIAEARVDARSLSEFVFKPAGFKVARRLAPTVDTLQFYIDRFDATKATTDAYVTTIPNIVNDAINNTAVEGGVLADTFVTVTANGTGSIARTQRDKNADVISVKDFGATGDGTTDDTAAFELLEANVTGRVIDLQGKTHLVDKAFNKNDYVNGKLLLSTKSMTTERGDFKHNYKTAATPINIRRGLVKPKAIGNLKRVAGNGSANVVQSFYADNINNNWYTLSAHDGLGAFVNRYASDTYAFRQGLDKTDHHAFLGHQGLTMEYRGKDGTDLLWTSMGYEPAPIAGYTDITGSYAVAFEYTPIASGAITNYEIWKVYNIPFNGSTSPCISVDGRFLITRMHETDATGKWRTIRVWDMATIRAMREKGDYDISELYIAEWQYDPYQSGVAANLGAASQALACDGSYIYALEGASSMTDPSAFILVYDMVGNHIDTVDISSIGWEYAQTLASNETAIYEAEGLQVVSTPSGGLDILVMYSLGNHGDRRCLVYSLNSSQTLNLVNDDENTPTTMLVGNSQGDDIHYLANRGFKLASVAGNGFVAPNKFQMGLEGTVLIGEGIVVDKPYSVYGTGFAGQQYLAVNAYKGSNTQQIRSNAHPAGPKHQFIKSRGVTNRETAAVVNNDDLGVIEFLGDDGFADWSNQGGVVGARITAKARGTIAKDKVGTRIIFATHDGLTENRNPTNRWFIDTDGTFLPIGAVNIGNAVDQLTDIYLKNSPVVSSDERLKQDFRSLKAAEKKAAIEIKSSICLYKMRDSVEEKGDAARWHVGVKAQQIVSIMESHGLQPFDYGFICYDEWEAESESLDDDGNVDVPAREAGDKYAIRYDELAMFILAAI